VYFQPKRSTEQEETDPEDPGVDLRATTPPGDRKSDKESFENQDPDPPGRSGWQ